MAPGGAGRGRSLIAALARALLALGALATLGPAAGAEPLSRAQSERLVREGRCSAALPSLEHWAREQPDAAILQALGTCRLRTNDYVGAVAALEQARALDPDRPDLDLALAVAHYHSGDRGGAARALERAAAREPDRAEVLLYQGLLAAEDADRAVEAASRLERARERDAAGVEPVASYYAGIAWQTAQDRERAREALERVVREYPDSEWAEAAVKQLEVLAQPTPARRWVSLEVGYEYDTNVVLRGRGVTLPDFISEQRDERLTWRLRGGAELFRSGDWSGGASFTYEGWVHETLDEFDLHLPQAVGWIDYSLDEKTTLRLEGDFLYAWLGGEPFVTSYGAALRGYRSFDQYGQSDLGLAFFRDQFHFRDVDVPDGIGIPGTRCPNFEALCGPLGVREDRERVRDGEGFSFELGHGIPLPAGIGLRGSYRFEHFSARGSEFSFQAHRFELTGTAPLPLGFWLEAWGRYTWQPYRNRSTFPDPGDLVIGRQYPLSASARTDTIWETEIRLERPLTEQLTLSARWRYVRNRSNVAVFDYRRHVIGVYLTVYLGS